MEKRAATIDGFPEGTHISQGAKKDVGRNGMAHRHRFWGNEMVTFFWSVIRATPPPTPEYA